MPPIDTSMLLDNWTILHPALCLAAGALVVLLIDLIMPPGLAEFGRSLWTLTSLGAVALGGYRLSQQWAEIAEKPVSAFGGAIVADKFSLVYSAILLGTALLALLLSVKIKDEDSSGYQALLLWATTGMLILVSAASLMTVFLGLEILSLALYVMVAFTRGDAKSKEAAFKYLILGSVAAGFLLFGFGLIYGVAGGTGFAQIAAYINGAAVPGGYFKVGLGLALVGFAFKLALVPFHMWAPDVYEGAPAPVTAFMSVGTKAAAFAALVRFLTVAAPAEDVTKYLIPLFVLAILSMFIGSLGAMRQNNIKRLMAYSGIGHAGYLFLALAGLGSDGVTASAYYLATYLFTSMGVFAVISWMSGEGEDLADLRSYRGLFFRRPAICFALSLFMFSLVGLPPAAGFTGKLLLATAAVKQGVSGGYWAWLMLTSLILTSGMSAFAYIRVILVMFQQGDEAVGSAHGHDSHGGAAARAEVAAAHDSALSEGSGSVSAALVLLVSLLGTLYLGVIPAGVIELMENLLK